MSPRRNWDSPIPSLVCECAPSPRTKGWGGHTRQWARGWGSPNSDDWRKSLALCQLCGAGVQSPSQVAQQLLTLLDGIVFSLKIAMQNML